MTQEWLAASLETLLEVHNISTPDHGPTAERQPPSLERFANLRVVTVAKAHSRRKACLPALPVSVRTLMLDSRRYGTNRCAGQRSGTAGTDRRQQHATAGRVLFRPLRP